jgi:HSP20 family molecular chaperone IbpA
MVTREREVTKRPESAEREVAPAQAERRRRVTPPVDILENDDEYLIVSDVPGVKTDDVQINFQDGELMLGAVRKVEAEGEPRIEYRRRFRVPRGIDATKIHAELQKGVLFLHLPKEESVKPKQIPVKVAG